MILHAKALGPFGFAAGALVVMTALGAHHAKIASRQFFKTRVTIALAKAFFGWPLAVATLNLTVVNKLNGLAYKGVEVNFLISQG